MTRPEFIQCRVCGSPFTRSVGPCLHGAPPSCGACPGDGSICATQCRVKAESPPVAPTGTAVTIRPLTDLAVVQRAAQMTTHGQPIKAPLAAWYRTEHSPVRARIFWIELERVPTFVSVHLTRHKAGVEHFVQSMRDDRGGAGDDVVTRLTPVNHGMLINAQALIHMSRKRLCYAASKRTVAAWRKVRQCMREVDPDLANYMVPECVYRNGICPEFKECRPGLAAVMKAYNKEKSNGN